MKKSRKNILAEVLLMAACLLYLFPIYIIVVNSFKSRAELYENILAFPGTFSFQYFGEAMDKMQFFTYYNAGFYFLYCCAFFHVRVDACTHK